MGRIMAIDYGDVRIGIAMTDPMQIIAGQSQTLANTPDTFSEIVRMVKSESVESIVLGMPYSEQATVGFAARKVVRFADGLLAAFSQNGISIPLYEQDEGYTTVSAYQSMSK
ncbi:MAG: pre-16S rRNA-processing nuclease YqgF, partial [Spirochaetales bacterium]|nr:pre-16S rRNA-processing nuclease YqgF [Spirochaetales bacterium]